jgi:hypothetical protein
MMREIKFRAWDKESNKMCYPEEEHELDKLDWEYVLITFSGRVWGIDEDFETNYDDDIFSWVNAGDITERFELMQYTGLKDKNGRESYWDDIVDDGINPPFPITPDYHLLARLSEIEFEVIGNIYENPDLIKKEE